MLPKVLQTRTFKALSLGISHVPCVFFGWGETSPWWVFFSVTPGSRKKKHETPQPFWLETSLKLTASWHLKLDAWKTRKFPFGWIPSWQVRFREGMPKDLPFFFLADVVYVLCLKIWHHQKQNDQRHGANMFFWRSGRSRYELVVIWRNGALSSLTSSYGKLEIKEKWAEDILPEISTIQEMREHPIYQNPKLRTKLLG